MSDDALSIHGHCRLTGADNANLGIGMLVQWWTFARQRVAEEERNARTIWLAFELHVGDRALALVAWSQKTQHR
jgi:hypothetical protein